MPEPLLSTLPILSHLIFVAVIKGRCCYPSRFSDEGIKSMSLKSRCRAHSRALTKARWTLEPCPWSLTTLAPRSPCSAGTSQRMLSNIRLPASFQGGVFGPDSLDTCTWSANVPSSSAYMETTPFFPELTSACSRQVAPWIFHGSVFRVWL